MLEHERQFDLGAGVVKHGRMAIRDGVAPEHADPWVADLQLTRHGSHHAVVAEQTSGSRADDAPESSAAKIGGTGWRSFRARWSRGFIGTWGGKVKDSADVRGSVERTHGGPGRLIGTF
jgi:hypothetical protein